MENNFAIPLESELTPGDGSCLAHALVDQMTHDPLLSLNRLDHHQLRKYVVNSLPQMITSGVITFDFDFETQFGTPTQWMEQALVPNSYLDFIFLEVASNVLNRRIRVLHVVGPISLNFDQSCLEPDQIPQNVRQSMRSLPDQSQLPPPPPENQSSMVKEKKQAAKRHVCPEQGCPKSITGYTQSHNLKDHMRKKHNSI